MITEAIKHLIKIYLKTPMMHYRKEKIRLTLLKLYSIYVALSKRKSKRSVWVRPIYSVEQRFRQCDSNNLVTMLRATDPSLHFNYLRMDVGTFEHLLSIVGPGIEKQTNIREPIVSHTRLQICLRYLASGDSMRSIGYAFRVSPNTVSQIIHETCDEIWLKLKDLVMPIPSKDAWTKIAEDFEAMWNFPHCMGAIDGKHIVIEAPPHSGSFYYNYKKTHSLNLTGIADAHYRFILVDVGAEGRRSDAGVFANSKLKSGLDANTLNVPPSSPVDQYELPFVLVADEAYPLSPYLMRPYPKSSQLDLKKKVFNYRLSRARQVIERTFGILAARWRIFRRPINTYVSKAEKIVLATICLHNFIITKELQKERRPQERQYLQYNGHDRQQTSLGIIRNIGNQINRDVISRNLSSIYRERFANYFVNEGAVQWQWEKAENNEF
ncbi:uncharacterized protein [Mycetomoellerius zeteki]|nr:PREDICTED: uncharacterized protein LOC108729033 isoform X1 [Trachymyrmex zeteki]